MLYAQKHCIGNSKVFFAKKKLICDECLAIFEVYFFEKMLEFSDSVNMFLEDEDLMDDYLDYVENKDNTNISKFPSFQNVSNKPIRNSMQNKNVQKKYNLNSLYKQITKRIIGQDEAVRTLLSIFIRNNMASNPFMKSNVFLIGGTGNGKSETIKQIAKELKIPYVIEDASKYTQEGYVGDSVENALNKLIDAANGDVKKAEHGMIFFDEIDKKTDNGDRSGVSTTSVQDSLLKMLEGTTMNVSRGRISTEFITFGLIGACENTYEERRKRLSSKGKIGFVNDSNSETNFEQKNPNFIPEDLIKSGFKSELIGRIDIIQEFKPMDIEMGTKIINDSQISIFNFYIDELKRLGVEVKMNRNEVVEEIVKRAIQLKTGARAIRQIVVEMFKNIYSKILIDNESQEKYICIISKDTVRDNSKFQLIKKENAKK